MTKSRLSELVGDVLAGVDTSRFVVEEKTLQDGGAWVRIVPTNPSAAVIEGTVHGSHALLNVGDGAVLDCFAVQPEELYSALRTDLRAIVEGHFEIVRYEWRNRLVKVESYIAGSKSTTHVKNPLLAWFPCAQQRVRYALYGSSSR
jgi:hypothetical protein